MVWTEPVILTIFSILLTSWNFQKGVSGSLIHTRSRIQNSAHESCQRRLIRMQIAHSQCQAKTVMSSACRGTCHSRSVPEWSYELQSVKMVSYCTCCKPRAAIARTVRLDCPTSSRRFRYFRLLLPVDCACRPCSDGRPNAEQPYDYD